MIPRSAQNTLLRLAKGFPILVVTGPRQSGKTTLTRHCFPEYSYVSLEDLDERAFASEDPRGFLARFETAVGVILDEVQHVPNLLSYLQTQTDNRPEMGRIVLTGSQQFGLMQAVSQSLAGRAGLVQLLPLSLNELLNQNTNIGLDQVLYNGLYPAIYQRDLSASDWYASYVSTYVERDVRTLLQVRDLATFVRFIKLCAARTGQILNIASLAADAGISQSAAKQWLSVLEASYVLFMLQPHHANYGKRLIKSPKLYFYDTGLAAYLLGIAGAQQMNTHSARPALFETLVISEAIKTQWHQGKTHNCYFWRDNAGLEVDLLIEHPTALQAIEIKSGQTIASDWFKGLHKWQKLAQSSLTPSLIYSGEESYQRSNVLCQSWRKMVFE